MTIAQQLLGKKECKQQEEPLVPSPRIKDAEEGRPVIVTMHSHVRRVNSLTTVCVFATALIVLATGIIGGSYLYKHFSQYKSRHYRGWCSIPYVPDAQQETNQQPLIANFKKNLATEIPNVNYFEEKIDIDIKSDLYERIEVPAFEHGRHAQFIHDFVANRTGIFDYESRRCFVIILNRNFVNPPRILYEQITKMRAGYYDADTRPVRHTLHITTPAISNLKHVGLVITRYCGQMPMYMLEKATAPVYKRSIDDKDLFIEFAGNRVNEFKIINLHDPTIKGYEESI